MSGINEIVRDFLIEGRDGLGQIEHALVLRRKSSSEKVLAGAFRAMHTLPYALAVARITGTCVRVVK